MKTNKINFDWSIFIAVMTICVVIICAVVCCCLALPSNDNGIAKAQENVDYLVAPGESYTTMQSCESMFQNYELMTYSNIVYFNFNFQYDELEFFNRFSVVINDFGPEYGGIDDSFYFYPLMTFRAERGSDDPTCFTIIVLGWDDYSNESGIYIMDDNFSADSFWTMIDDVSSFTSFNRNYGDFIFASFNKVLNNYNIPKYTNRITNNFIWLDSFHNLYFDCYFDSSFITDYLDGYDTYDESIVSYFDSFMSANGVFNKNAVYVAPDDSGMYGSSDYNFKGYLNFNYNVKNTYLNTLSSDFNTYIQNSNDFYYNEQYELYVIASCSLDEEFQLHFGFRYGISDMLSIYSEEEGRFIPNQLIMLDSFLPFYNSGVPYMILSNLGFSYISPFWYSDYCSLDIGMFFSMSDNFLSYGDVQVLKQQKQYNQQLAQKDEEIAQKDEVIDSLQESITYYESLELNYRYVPINYLAGIKTYSFTKDGINYSSNSIERSSNAREIYNSYNNAQLDVPPESMGVCFAVELDKTYNNVKFKFSPIIDCYYQYTICSEPDESGTQQCYQHNGIFNGINVGYVRQNGEIEYLGQYSSMPGASDGEFLLNYPTNTLVFYYNGMTQITLPDIFTLGLYMYDPDKIYNDGYEVGFNKGYTEGKNVGYYEGLGADTDISFFALFTSVFDAPITSIVGKWGDSDGDGVYEREGGMLNFYIPGLEINFAPFLLSLFTIAVIVLIIRFILARKS